MPPWPNPLVASVVAARTAVAQIGAAEQSQVAVKAGAQAAEAAEVAEAGQGRRNPPPPPRGPPSPPPVPVVVSEVAEAAVITSRGGRRPPARLGAGVVEETRQLC